MSTGNAFLNEFIKMRQSIKEKEVQQAEKSHKKSHDLRRMPEPMTTTMSLATIIEDKPCKSKIIEYLTQKRDICMDADDSD
jgi:C4-type Zn-finger protein